MPQATINSDQWTGPPSFAGEGLYTCAYYDPGFSDFLHSQLDELGQLQRNWDGYGSPPLEQEILAAAHDWVDHLPEHLAIRPMVIPLPCSGVRFEWNDGPRSLQLEFDSPDTIHYLKWNPDAGMEEEETFPPGNTDQAVSLIQWFMSDFTHGE